MIDAVYHPGHAASASLEDKIPGWRDQAGRGSPFARGARSSRSPCAGDRGRILEVTYPWRWNTSWAGPTWR